MFNSLNRENWTQENSWQELFSIKNNRFNDRNITAGFPLVRTTGFLHWVSRYCNTTYKSLFKFLHQHFIWIRNYFFLYPQKKTSVSSPHTPTGSENSFSKILGVFLAGVLSLLTVFQIAREPRIHPRLCHRSPLPVLHAYPRCVCEEIGTRPAEIYPHRTNTNYVLKVMKATSYSRQNIAFGQFKFCDVIENLINTPILNHPAMQRYQCCFSWSIHIA